MSAEFKTQSQRLFNKYHPIEKDNIMTPEVRNMHMNDWWQQSLDLVIAEKLTIPKLKNCVLGSQLYFRHGIKELFGTMKSSGVHCYVVSAGLKPIIHQAFTIFGRQTEFDLDERLTICSTEEKYSPEGIIDGFKAPIITCANKYVLFTHARYPTLKPNSNAILLGDLIDDLTITSSLELSNRLTIGMLNSCDTSELENYMKNFDIVIASDGNLIHVAQLLDGICGTEANDYKKFGENAKMVDKIMNI